MNMSQGGSRHGGERGQFDQQADPDGWAVGSAGPHRPPPKAGDLSNFGRINKSARMTSGLSSVFESMKENKGVRSESLSRTASSQAEAASNASQPLSRKARRKLNPLPRSELTEQESTPASADASEGREVENGAKRRINEDSREFFAVRNLEEAEVYFTNLTGEHRFRLVEKLVTAAIESKEADARLVGDFFDRSVSKELCSQASFEEGFLLTAEILDDTAIDAPKAFDLMAIMMKGANLDEERQTRIAAKSMDSDKLIALLS